LLDTFWLLSIPIFTYGDKWEGAEGFGERRASLSICNGRAHANGGAYLPGIVEALDIGEEALAGLADVAVFEALYAFGLEGSEERFHRRVVVAIAFGAPAAVASRPRRLWRKPLLA